jgi:hypothetical protein
MAAAVATPEKVAQSAARLEKGYRAVALRYEVEMKPHIAQALSRLALVPLEGSGSEAPFGRLRVWEAATPAGAMTDIGTRFEGIRADVVRLDLQGLKGRLVPEEVLRVCHG